MRNATILKRLRT